MVKASNRPKQAQNLPTCRKVQNGNTRVLCKRFVVRQGKKATHKYLRAEGGFSGPSKVQGPVPKPVLVAKDNSTVVAYINKEKPTQHRCERS